MKTNFVLVSVLITILIGGAFGLSLIDEAFAQNLYVSSDDSEAYKKQKEEQKKAEKAAKAKEKQQELEVKAKEKRKELEQKKAEKAAKAKEKQQELEVKAKEKQQELEVKAKEKQQELEVKAKEKQQELEVKAKEKQQELEVKAKEKQQELEVKAKEKQQELEVKAKEKQQELEVKAKEKQQELEQKKAELETNRQNLETKQLKKLKEYEEKLKEIKEKSQKKIEKNITNDQEKLSQSNHTEEKLIKKSENIQKKLAAKSDELDSRTKNILDKINNGKYMGEKTTSFIYTETYELVFDSVKASMINDKLQTSFLTGKMNFTTYDKNKSNLKLELDECTVTVDEIIYHCGFGKARTTSSGESGTKDSLVIVAFLESDLLEDVHTTLKIFLNADIPINKIEQSSVSILGPQSKISDMWFLNGTATLSKVVLTSEKITTGTNSTIENGIN